MSEEKKRKPGSGGARVGSGKKQGSGRGRSPRVSITPEMGDELWKQLARIESEADLIEEDQTREKVHAAINKLGDLFHDILRI